MSNQTGFYIESYNLEENSILVKPYSPLFKNPLSAYPCYNFTITNLNLNEDISVQLAKALAPVVENILSVESGFSESLVNTLDNLKNQPVALDYSSVNSQVATNTLSYIVKNDSDNIDNQITPPADISGINFIN
jgi:hypothetical protein